MIRICELKSEGHIIFISNNLGGSSKCEGEQTIYKRERQGNSVKNLNRSKLIAYHLFTLLGTGKTNSFQLAMIGPTYDEKIKDST